MLCIDRHFRSRGEETAEGEGEPAEGEGETAEGEGETAEGGEEPAFTIRIEK